jgi:hypothetical protein
MITTEVVQCVDIKRRLCTQAIEGSNGLLRLLWSLETFGKLRKSQDSVAFELKSEGK